MKTIAAALIAATALTALPTAPLAQVGAPGVSRPQLQTVQWRRGGGRDWNRHRRWRRHRDHDGDVAAAAVVAGIAGLVIGSALLNDDDDRPRGWREPQPSPYATEEEARQDWCRAQYGPAYDPADDCVAQGDAEPEYDPDYDPDDGKAA